MTGNREIFAGTWRWYETDIERWYDIGNSDFFKWTPDSVGYDYYFTISENGLFKGYRNDTLIHDFILNSVYFESYSGVNADAIELTYNCSTDRISLVHWKSNPTLDTLYSGEVPLNFDDEENHLRSHRNYFVKQ